ncbi:MAG: hypothetical protein ABJA98_23010 [Acidobacteriota bacterium]
MSTDFFSEAGTAAQTTDGDRPLTTLEVLDDEYWALSGGVPSAESQALREAYVRSRRAVDTDTDADAQERAFRHDVITRLHHAKRSALCFSGGGIRSATFGLGLLQGLSAAAADDDARPRLVGEIDFLSTVSGGGYLGAWFSAWATRLARPGSQWFHVAQPDEADGPAGVFRLLVESPQTLLDPDPKPVRYLRDYSNYLTPKLGTFSADTWAFIGSILRNLFLNWLVLLPLLAAVLLVPLAAQSMLNADAPDATLWFLVISGFLLGALATGYVGYDLPSAGNAGNRYTSYLCFCLVPLTLAAVHLNTFWAWLHNAPPGSPAERWYDIVALGKGRLSFWYFGMFGAAMHAGGMGGGLLLAMWHFQRPAKRTGVYCTLAAAATGFAGGLLAYGLTRPTVGASFDVTRYVVLAFPLVMSVFLFAGTLLVGLTSYVTDDKDREWWARSGGTVLAMALAWPIAAGTVLYAANVLTFAYAQIATAAGAAGTGLAAARLGGSSGSSSGRRGDGAVPASTPGSMVKDVAARLVLPVFIVLLAMLLAWVNQEAAAIYVPGFLESTGLTSVTHAAGRAILVAMRGIPILSTAGNSIAKLYSVTEGVLWTGAAYALLCGWASYFINVNSFSLHGMYKQRLIRAYLGASNAHRHPHPFTGFDEKDNMAMCALTTHKPMHVVNIALNLVGGSKLAWQQRKAESFTSTRLHTGSLRIGYRPSTEYGGKYKPGTSAISLGTAMTISGAAASPNMGYNSSSLLELVMTLFNARLGWWLGNPCREMWRLRGPRFGVRPFIDEAFGLTNDTNTWVYLSDGGHFENLALYEMVLRRCKVIIVSDAGADPGYTYQDLGNAVRKIRIDMGIAIEFRRPMPMSPTRMATSEFSGHHAAIADIRYGACDGGEDGILVYLKPSLSGDEPADVHHYAAENIGFPHQTTADQFFNESQFESYRRLGLHVVERIRASAPDAGQMDLHGFVAAATAYCDGHTP